MAEYIYGFGCKLKLQKVSVAHFLAVRRFEPLYIQAGGGHTCITAMPGRFSSLIDFCHQQKHPLPENSELIFFLAWRAI